MTALRRLGGDWSVRMSRRRIYRSPPVAEVILDLQFQNEAPPEQLHRVPERIGGSLGDPVPVMRISNQALVSPRRIENQEPEHLLWGWEFLAEDPRRLVTVAADRITQNLLRSKDWPSGEYLGWERNSESFRKLLEVVEPMFADLTIRRAGLRYINRVVIEKRADLEDWFTVVPAPLELVTKLWDFTFTRTWESGIDFPQHSATVTLTKSDPPKDMGDDTLGVTLDIDVFNLWVKDAPDFDAVPEWFHRAHLFENTVFESCITKALAVRFQPKED